MTSCHWIVIGSAKQCKAQNLIIIIVQEHLLPHMSIDILKIPYFCNLKIYERFFIFLHKNEIFIIFLSNTICAEVKSPKVLQYSPIARGLLRGHNCCYHVYMSQTLCLQFLVHVHAPSEFQGKKATESHALTCFV